MKTSAMLGCLLMAAMSAELAGACGEKPQVQMDERAAQSHLLASKNPELPAGRSKLLGTQRVVVLVTVDRKGTICAAKAIEGPGDLRELAVDAVSKHWKFRPFLVDWKPVVAQFPISVRFVRLRTRPELKVSLQGSACHAGGLI